MIFKNISEGVSFKNIIVKAKLISVEGSVPRNKGTFMLISSKYIFGSIGGGNLEYKVINKAKIILKKRKKFTEEIISIPLGPSIGQCCGGYVQVKITKHKNGMECFSNEKKIENTVDNLFIFGAGHIGKELSAKSIDLDFNVHVIDSRKEYLENQFNTKIAYIYAKFPWMLIKNLPKNSFFIIMTHSHDFDFKIINEILNINNFKFLGLIGSKTKKKRFENRFLKLGYNKLLLNKIECPIGIKSITSKNPGEIAISIIARLLEYRSALSVKIINHTNNLKKINE